MDLQCDAADCASYSADVPDNYCYKDNKPIREKRRMILNMSTESDTKLCQILKSYDLRWLLHVIMHTETKYGKMCVS